MAWFILHQVSAVHTAKLITLLGLDDKKVFKTFPEYGNVGPAAAGSWEKPSPGSS